MPKEYAKGMSPYRDSSQSPFALTDVFTVPMLDGYLLYLPRRGLVLGVDAAVHDLVERIKRGETAESDEFTAPWLHALCKLGVLDEVHAPIAPVTSQFQPTHVTLSLTRHCNLRCVYCYARAGEDKATLDPRAARAALRLAADNATDRTGTSFQVAFHGEGEPTCAWNLFQDCILYAESLAEEREISVDFSMSTNAIWSKSQRQFISRHFRHLSISLDGLPDIQNTQRPTANGKESFAIVMESLRAMDASGVAYGVRATVLPDGVERMLPFLDFLAENTRANTLTLEPVFQSGRGIALRIDKPTFYRRFTEAYRQVQQHGATRGLDVTYSGCRPTVSVGRFCQAIGPDLNFVVMTSGLVSSCYEINDPHSDKGRLVIYGHYDPTANSFIFDEEKLARLRGHGVWNMPGCRNCFAKWNCGGDCLARCDLTLAALDAGPNRTGSPRCELNRTLTSEALMRYGIAADLLQHNS